MSSRKAVCLLSGGLDSSTCLALARRDGYECYALSFDYGQRHRIELDAAARVAAAFGAREHRTARIDLRAFGASALTADIDVPKHRSPAEMEQGIPITYVPARNTIFLSFALAWAEVLEASDIFIGVNALDYSGYPDCRPEFIQAFERMANLATKAGVEGRTHIQIHTPLIALSKAEIVRLAAQLGLDFTLTHSCYDPDPEGRPCGQCDSCLLRAKVSRKPAFGTRWYTAMKISEIFYSIQGEGILAGVPSVFMRTSGCNLRCTWCDTPYTSWKPEGDDLSLDNILADVRAERASHVVVTGGEPMIQPEIVRAYPAAQGSRSAHHH